MCIMSAPKPATIDTVKRENVVEDKDVTAQAAETEKKRKGFNSTVATPSMGLMDVANVRKVTLGS